MFGNSLGFTLGEKCLMLFTLISFGWSWNFYFFGWNLEFYLLMDM
jgi:hypothetical protein